MRNAVVAVLAISLAACAHAPGKPNDCDDLRLRVERDARTDRIVTVDVVCDGRVIPQTIGTPPIRSRKVIVEEADNG